MIRHVGIMTRFRPNPLISSIGLILCDDFYVSVSSRKITHASYHCPSIKNQYEISEWYANDSARFGPDRIGCVDSAEAPNWLESYAQRVQRPCMRLAFPRSHVGMWLACHVTQGMYTQWHSIRSLQGGRATVGFMDEVSCASTFVKCWPSTVVASTNQCGHLTENVWPICVVVCAINVSTSE